MVHCNLYIELDGRKDHFHWADKVTDTTLLSICNDMLLVVHQFIDSAVVVPDRYLSFHVFYPHYLYCCPRCYDCYKSVFIPMHHYNHQVYKWLCSFSLSAIWKNSQLQTSELVLAGERCAAESSQYISDVYWAQAANSGKTVASGLGLRVHHTLHLENTQSFVISRFLPN